MIKRIILLWMLIYSMPVLAASSSFLDRPENNGLTLSQFVKKADDCSGVFEESVLQKNGIIKKSHGNFWWKQGAWKWEYLGKTNQKELVMIDTVEQSVQIDNGLKQITINESNLNSSPISLFTTKLNNDKYDLKYLKDNDCCEVFEVRLKDLKKEDVSLQSDNAIIWMDKKNNLPKKIMFKTPFGDIINIMLSGVKVNTKLQTSDFSYTVGDMDVMKNIK